jgi:hypothetical protein
MPENFFYSINKLVVCFAPPAPRSQISDNEPAHFQTLATPLAAKINSSKQETDV